MTDELLDELEAVRGEAYAGYLKAANLPGPPTPERSVAWSSQLPEPKPYCDRLRLAINWALAHRWTYPEITVMMGIEPTDQNVDAVRHAQRRRNRLAEAWVTDDIGLADTGDQAPF